MTELNPQGVPTIARFFEAMLPLTVVTVWIIVAFQSRFVVRDESMWKKLLWPIVLLNNMRPKPSEKRIVDDEYEFPLRRGTGL